MNKVYLSGIIADPPMQSVKGDGSCHVSLTLCVSHKTKLGQIRRELYSVQAWRGVAEWATRHLQQGQRVMLQGYLTQRCAPSPSGGMQSEVEVTAEEFFPVPVPVPTLQSAV